MHLTATFRCGKCKNTLGPIASPVDATTEIFDELTAATSVPVLVDFWAAWCGPCQLAAPEIARVAANMAGRALVLKVDIDRHPDLAARFGVQGIPNFVVLKNGQVLRRQSGLVPHSEMQRWLEDARGVS